MATVNSILSPHELTASGSYTASATYVVLGNAGWTVPRGQTTDALFVAHVGANYARTLNVDATLSTTLQDVEVGGTASALQLATNKAKVVGSLEITGQFRPALVTTNGTPSNVLTSTLEIRDSAGTLVGYVPVYETMG